MILYEFIKTILLASLAYCSLLNTIYYYYVWILQCVVEKLQ